ncbi:PREDICTED: protein-lysine N-methyltransferase EEF2KMT-like isoform X3 [Amphimedon queenslandica]|nr:PREDICTED: protein-lysine N-methyltransferase EEF2KMT-like isoform X3 [Amphimedon queenslandica]|eukprot:XP_019852147.1 PREDICTED: protein-lysine N-methyltransferase EEF2KMT-like isoform X3 [Amphimedon queenslandica]
MLKYPPPLDYQLSFLKQWMKLVEDSNQELIEEIYELYTSLISKGLNDDDRNYCYKSYYLGEGDVFVTLKESRHIVSGGTTGLCTWQASMELAEWIAAEQKEAFNNKHILELGSGIGFLGLSVLKLTSPLSYTFTDCNVDVLKLLKNNVDINNIPGVPPIDTFTVVVKFKQKTNQCSCLFVVCYTFLMAGNQIVSTHLDWNSCEQLDFPPVDIVLASDVIYDTELIDPFINVLEKLLRPVSPARVPPVAYVASTIRNEDTYSQFLQKIDGSSLLYKEVKNELAKRIFYYDRRLIVSILEITYNNN